MFAKIGEKGFVRITVIFMQFCINYQEKQSVMAGFKMRNILTLAAVSLLLFSCSSTYKAQPTVPPKSTTPPVVYPPKLPPIEDHAPVSASKELQFFIDVTQSNPSVKALISNFSRNGTNIIYTEINRSADNSVRLVTRVLNEQVAAGEDGGASAALLLSMLSLQKINNLQSYNVDEYSTMINDGYNSRLAGAYNDAATLTGKPSIAQYIKRLMVGNDAEAYNRLYEFLGQDYINAFVQKVNKNNLVAQRMGNYSKAENRITNAIFFMGNDGNIIYKQPVQNASQNNAGIDHFSLETAQQVLQLLFFPQSSSLSNIISVSEGQRTFLKSYLGLVPRQSSFPSYPDTMADAFDKYLYYGGSAGKKDSRLKIYNCSRVVNGYITDVAYVADLDRKVEFMLSATVKQKGGEISGADFLKNLGEAFYKYEIKRPRTFLPNFNDLPLATDK